MVRSISLDDHTADNALESIRTWKRLDRRGGLELGVQGCWVSGSSRKHKACIFLQGVLQEEYGDEVDDGVVLQVGVEGEVKGSRFTRRSRTLL